MVLFVDAIIHFAHSSQYIIQWFKEYLLILLSNVIETVAILLLPCILFSLNSISSNFTIMVVAVRIGKLWVIIMNRCFVFNTWWRHQCFLAIIIIEAWVSININLLVPNRNSLIIVIALKVKTYTSYEFLMKQILCIEFVCVFNSFSSLLQFHPCSFIVHRIICIYFNSLIIENSLYPITNIIIIASLIRFSPARFNLIIQTINE